MQKEVKYVVYKELYDEETFNSIKVKDNWEIPPKIKRDLTPVETIICCYTETADYAERLTHIMNSHSTIPHRPILYLYRALDKEENEIKLVGEEDFISNEEEEIIQ